MYKSAVLLCLVVTSLSTCNGDVLGRLQNYTRIFGFTTNERNNELWHGIIKDCSKKVTFSCIQKNAYSYLDRAFIDRDNITVFDGLKLTKNNLDYEACYKDGTNDNLVEDTTGSDEGRRIKSDFESNKVDEEAANEEEEEEYLTPLEEVTQAFRKRTIKFLATRDYEIKLPNVIGSGSSFKISPREIDENGALIRIDFNTRAVEEQQHGRIFFKKIKKQIQNKLIMTLLLLILLIKIIKLKFMFVIPFLFGIGTAKKLFLKLLLFFVPAFAHVFKLCSSYYSAQGTKYHHHHHKIAHHHHHIPVPVPVYSNKPPAYYDHPPPSSSSHSHGPPSSGPIILDEDFQGYDYAHPHIQYRKDMEELKEWGITPSDEPYDEVTPDPGVIPGVYQRPTTPIGPYKMPKFPGPMGMPPPFSNPKPGYGPMYGPEKILPPHNPQNLAYSGYAHPPMPPPHSSSNNRQSGPPAVGHMPPGMVGPSVFGPPVTQATKQQNYGPVSFTPQSASPLANQQQRNDLQLSGSAPAVAVPVAVPPTSKPFDDEFYGPIVERLDEIFAQLRFVEESCRERLVCSMYKNPALYSPHSNLVSNELSRDPQELQQGNVASASSQRFYRYLNAARLGQDGGDCLKAFHCSIKTE